MSWVNGLLGRPLKEFLKKYLKIFLPKNKEF
jgi:hypothetical protein